MSKVLAIVEREYAGGVERYLKQELSLTEEDISTIRWHLTTPV
jgi:hypothetical protein